MLNTHRHDRKHYGIYWVKLRSVYEVKFRVNKQMRHYGWHDTLEDATNVRDAALCELNRTDELPFQVLANLTPDHVMSDQSVTRF